MPAMGLTGAYEMAPGMVRGRVVHIAGSVHA